MASNWEVWARDFDAWNKPFRLETICATRDAAATVRDRLQFAPRPKLVELREIRVGKVKPMRFRVVGGLGGISAVFPTRKQAAAYAKNHPAFRVEKI